MVFEETDFRGKVVINRFSGAQTKTLDWNDTSVGRVFNFQVRVYEFDHQDPF